MSKRRVVFIVTQECQLRCNYCYLVGKNSNGKMTWESAKQIADFLMSLPVSEDEVIFDFIGGEPLLEIDLISRISDYLVNQMEKLNHQWKHNYSFRLTTNGLSYSSPKVQAYVLKYLNNLSVQISIDGTKRKHDLNRVFPNGDGSYDKLLPNVLLWKKQFGNRARSFMVISHEDLIFLSESVLHLISLGISDIYVSLVVEDVWMYGDDIIFERELMIIADYIIDNRLWNSLKISLFRKELGVPETDEHIYPCGNPMYVFDAKGNIFTCVRFVEYSLRNKRQRIIGNVNSGIDFNKIRPFRSFDRESCYPDKCLKCEYGSCCRWCPAENYDSSGTGTIFERTTTVCSLHKVNTKVKNYFWNKIMTLEYNDRS